MDLSSFGVEVKDNKPKYIEDENLKLNLREIKGSLKKDDKDRFLPWFLKYQLKSFDDIIVTSQIKKILDFFENFKVGKGLLLVGKAGSGKTTTLNLVGEKYDFEIFEMNASDNRNKKSIDESLGDVVKQSSLFDKKKMILVDEVDGVSGNNDRGGVAQIISIIKTCKYPIVFTANDKESDKIKALKKVCQVIDFENHSKELLFEIGKRILSEEKIEFKEELLKEFIEVRNTIDIRGFINDLQSSVWNSNFSLNEELELRDYKKKIESLLEKIYFSYPEDSYFSSFNNDITIDELFLYLEENSPNAYTKNILILAFNEISKADLFRGRIMKWQYWRYLVYVNFYLTFGVSSVKSEGYNVKKSIIKQNTRILKKWIYSNKVNALRARTKVEKKGDVPLRFIEKLAKYYQCSAKRCRSRDLFYFAFSYQNSVEFAKSMNDLFDIDDATKKALLEL